MAIFFRQVGKRVFHWFRLSNDFPQILHKVKVHLLPFLLWAADLFLCRLQVTLLRVHAAIIQKKGLNWVRTFGFCPYGSSQLDSCGILILLAVSLLSLGIHQIISMWLWLFDGFRCWYGWALSDSSVEPTFQENWKCVITHSSRGRVWNNNVGWEIRQPAWGEPHPCASFICRHRVCWSLKAIDQTLYKLSHRAKWFLEDSRVGTIFDVPVSGSSVRVSASKDSRHDFFTAGNLPLNEL